FHIRAGEVVDRPLENQILQVAGSDRLGLANTRQRAAAVATQAEIDADRRLALLEGFEPLRQIAVVIDAAGNYARQPSVIAVAGRDFQWPGGESDQQERGRLLRIRIAVGGRWARFWLKDLTRKLPAPQFQRQDPFEVTRSAIDIDLVDAGFGRRQGRFRRGG